MTRFSDRGLIERLRELIAALERRVPQLQRPGEKQIARDAATLRTRAEARLAELDRKPGHPSLGIDK